MLDSAILREAIWTRSNSFWGMFRFKRRSATLGANSGFDPPSMIALASSRILEPSARLWKDCRLFAQNRRPHHGGGSGRLLEVKRVNFLHAAITNQDRGILRGQPYPGGEKIDQLRYVLQT